MEKTKEQKLAIEKEGTNILVSAGAGSGKTAVLTERVFRKVQEGIDIQKILVLTFTNEAALEMKNRIREKLEEAGLTKQLEYLDSAFITTFDAFALHVVKKYHYLLNINKNVAIIDASIIDLEKKKIIQDIFLELYEKKDPDFLKLIGDFTNRDDTIIKEAILNIKNSLDLIYDKKKYLEEYITNYYNVNYVNKIFEEYFKYLKSLALEVEDNLYILEDLLDEKLYLKVYEQYSKLIKPKTYNDLYKVHDKIKQVQFRNISEEAVRYKDSLKEKASLILELTKYREEELKEQYLMTENYVRAIIKIILILDERLEKYKLENNAFEFLDIAKMAIKIVKENPKIREEFKNNYNEILIDEYQDTNDLQEMFIKEIANNNVYMVGDIKQSIYRFRNANPQIFKQKYEEYEKHLGGEKIDLLKNFRSRKEVLNNINEIFNILMSDDLGSANYLKNGQMVFGNLAYEQEGANKENHQMEIWLYEDDKTFSNTEIEAFKIAQDIKEKIKNDYQIYDFKLKTNRKVLYSDFCIILDRGTQMARYKKIFEYLNIPMEVYKDSDLSVADDILILKNIISLILKINNQEYDTEMRYAWVSIARSFLGNLTDEEIFKRLEDNTFYESDIYKKCWSLASNLEIKTPKILLEEIIDKFEFYDNLILVGEIESSINRLDYLKDLVLGMEKLGFTIANLKDYLEEMLENKMEIRYKEAKSNLNCVKIMNIHKSKGLQFPICYFAGFKKDFNLKDLQSRFLFDKTYGILAPFYKEGIGIPFTKELIKDNYYKEEISEKIRLFYVALTRAQEKIIMVMPNLNSDLVKKEPVSLTEGRNFRSFYDFLKSMAGNLKKYVQYINLDSLNLTKDYDNITLKKQVLKNEASKIITFKENNIKAKLIEKKHASKTIKKIITKEEKETLEYGTKLHEMLEYVNFKEESTNKYVNNLKAKFDFENANIYQELEFIYDLDDEEYHGIIDLMLEYDDEIKIIDYKLKNIGDEEYQKQLKVYYDYIKQVSNKNISLYLYSLLDDDLKEVKIKQIN